MRKLKKPTALLALCIACFGILFFTACNEPHRNEWGSWFYVTHPTCTEYGMQKRRCILDPAQYQTRSVDPFGHSEGGDWTVITQPTCIHYGLEKGVCSHCDDNITRPINPNPDSHDWDWKVITEPTYYEPGKKEGACLHCGETDIRIIPPLGDNDDDKDIVDLP